MDSESRSRRLPNPRQNASIFSKITFWYTIKLFKKGFKHELEEEDLYEVLPEFESCGLGDRIEYEWERQKHRKNAMFVVLWNMFGPYYWILSLNMLFHITFHIVHPLVISQLVFLLAPNQKKINLVNIYLYSALLTLLLFIDVICRHNYFFLTENLIIKIRTAICMLVYRKLLKFPASRLKHISFGNVINLITRDINSFYDFFLNLSYGWSSFIIIGVACYNVYKEIGSPAVILIVMVVLLLIIQVLTGVATASFKNAACKQTDTRITVLQEALSRVRSIKMYVWEQYVEKKITAIRKKETHSYLKVVFSLIFSVVCGITVTNATFYIALVTCIWFGQQLSSETIYFIGASFINLSVSLSMDTPYATFNFAQVVAAVKRMQILLVQLEPEYEPLELSDESCHPNINLKNISVVVDHKVILNNVSFDIDKGLMLITGPASSGKSILLMTLLREFKLSKGDVMTCGRISYASQQPWLFPSTVKQNILFGSKYDHKRYQDVLRACDLQYDFDMMPNGDSTVVVDQGINLSKGQRSRISLARAIYKESDIYLLDDCLSSLDTLVARYIFTNCILSFLKDKIVLLVTHNKSLVPYCNKVLKINEGHVEVITNSNPKQIDDLLENTFIEKKVNLEKSEVENDEISNNQILVPKQTMKGIYGENKNSGAVSFKIYQEFVKLGGGSFFLLIIFILYVVTQVLLGYKENLIHDWANLQDETIEANKSTRNNSHPSVLLQKNTNFTFKFTATLIGISLSTISRAIALLLFCKRVSVKLHSKMLNNILNAPMHFFEKCFIGNMVNRFSKDLVIVDENIPLSLYYLSTIIFEAAGNLLILALIDLQFMIPILILFVCFALLRHVCLKTGNPLKRLEASTKSPVIGYLNATLEGLLTIKVFGAQSILTEEFEYHHNLYNSTSFSYNATLKAFVFACDLCLSIFVGTVIFYFAIFSEGVLPADFGLAVSQTFVIGTVLFFALYKQMDLEMEMTAVERAIEYTTISNEAKTGLEIKNWPKEGRIIFENVCLTLDEPKTYLLKNINFLIQPKEKIGIVGRTGAGKSSLVATLFRLYEFEGKITIDGTDSKTMLLSSLRSHISVIPQDPILFDGSLRDNIDPEGKFKDEEIWNALETVTLKKSLEKMNVDINELNLTCGQHQLVCLARVLLSKNKLLVLDEMVENVDNESETLVYDIINKHFASSTVIIIAHKLRFVMNCDKIAVLNNGEIVEYGTPHSLLENKNGLFYKMSLNGNIN